MEMDIDMDMDVDTDPHGCRHGHGHGHLYHGNGRIKMSQKYRENSLAAESVYSRNGRRQASLDRKVGKDSWNKIARTRQSGQDSQDK